MKQVFPLGKFYGETRRQFEISAFVMTEVEDFVNSNVPVHTHENAHFLFVLKGKFQATIKDKKQLCLPSTMIYYPAGTTHCDHFASSGGRFLTISLTSQTNNRLLEEIKFSNCSIDFKSSEISWLGKRISKEIQSPDCLSSIVLEGMANELLVYAARSLEKPSKPPAWLKQAHDLIRDCCDKSVTVYEIARQVGIHPLHLTRIFRRFFDCTPGEYLRKCRIEMASNLLVNSKKSLVEIALLSGFNDQSQFTRSFKQNIGITPAKYRQAHRS